MLKGEEEFLQTRIDLQRWKHLSMQKQDLTEWKESYEKSFDGLLDIINDLNSSKEWVPHDQHL